MEDGKYAFLGKNLLELSLRCCFIDLHFSFNFQPTICYCTGCSSGAKPSPPTNTMLCGNLVQLG